MQVVNHASAGVAKITILSIAKTIVTNVIKSAVSLDVSAVYTHQNTKEERYGYKKICSY